MTQLNEGHNKQLALWKRLAILALVYTTLKYYIRLEDKIALLEKHNYQACILSWFDPKTCTGQDFPKDEETNEKTHFVLTEDEKRSLITNYIQEDANTKIKDNCKIGVGYQMCLDVSIHAVDLIKKLEPLIYELEKKEG